MEAFGQGFGFVAVRHPDMQRARETFKESASVGEELDVGEAVLTLLARPDFASELLRHVVQSVAYAEHRDSEMQHLLVGDGSVFFVDGRRASRQDDAAGAVALDLFEGSGAGKYDGEDVLFADAARNELGVLRAEVKNDD